MIFQKQIVGKFSKLRAVRVSDASFILNLRLDEKLSKFINKVEDNLLMQENWIREQQDRIGDYYFLILDLEDNPKGTISLYNIENNKAEFGRWVSVGNAIENIESVILLHSFAFDELILEEVYTNTVFQNKQVINFHKKFGATLVEEPYFDSTTGFEFIRGCICKKDFETIFKKNYKILEMLG